MADSFNVPGIVEPFGAFSSAAWQPEGKVLHVSGHVSQDAEGTTIAPASDGGSMEAQTRQALGNIRAVLAHAGGTMDDVIKVTVFVTDVSEIATIHKVRYEFFDPPYPASTLVQVAQLIDPDWLIEIEAIAVIPADRVRRPSG
jgi:enamine deaminase RidA (YjgF/YER057c/UK114 family)